MKNTIDLQEQGTPRERLQAWARRDEERAIVTAVLRVLGGSADRGRKPDLAAVARALTAHEDRLELLTMTPMRQKLRERLRDLRRSFE